MIVPTGIRSESGSGMYCFKVGRRTSTVPLVGVATTLFAPTGGGRLAKPSMSNGAGGDGVCVWAATGAAVTAIDALSACRDDHAHLEARIRQPRRVGVHRGVSKWHLCRGG